MKNSSDLFFSAPKTGQLSLPVFYQEEIEEVIKTGKYNRVNPKIKTANFAVNSKLLNKEIKYEAKLFCFNRLLYSEELNLLLAKLGFKSAGLRELLHFNAGFPIQRGLSVIALGDVLIVSSKEMFVPGIFKDYKGRSDLELYRYEGIWPSSCRFLGLRESDS